MVIKPLEGDSTPGTVKPFQVSLVEPVAYQFQLLLSAITRRWLENQFLHAPRFDLADDDLIRVAAINHVDHLKARRCLAGASEPAKHFAVELGLVDFAGDVPRSMHVAVRIRIRKKDVLVLAAGNTDCPADANAGDLLHGL